MVQINWTQIAKNDLKDIAEYIYLKILKYMLNFKLIELENGLNF